MREIGFLVWALVVVAGVVSSIVQSARKRAAQNSPAGSVPDQRLSELRRLSQQIVVNVGPSGQVQAPARPAAAPPRPPNPTPKPAAPPSAVKPSAPAASAAEPALGLPLIVGDGLSQSRLRFAHLFGSRRKLSEAFIVSEVIGKPLALRNE